MWRQGLSLIAALAATLAFSSANAQTWGGGYTGQGGGYGGRPHDGRPRGGHEPPPGGYGWDGGPFSNGHAYQPPYPQDRSQPTYPPYPPYPGYGGSWTGDFYSSAPKSPPPPPRQGAHDGLWYY